MTAVIARGTDARRAGARRSEDSSPGLLRWQHAHHAESRRSRNRHAPAHQDRRRCALLAATKFRDRAKCEGVLITRGENGMWLSCGEVEGALPATAREVSDVTGAGDTAVATLALALAAGATYAEAAQLANEAAGSSSANSARPSSPPGELLEHRPRRDETASARPSRIERSGRPPARSERRNARAPAPYGNPPSRSAANGSVSRIR